MSNYVRAEPLGCQPHAWSDHWPILMQLKSVKENQNDEYGQLHASGLHCTGRIILNLWRTLRSELKLNIYTFESCVAAVLQLRVPHIPAHELAQWFGGGPSGVALTLHH